MPEAPRVGCAMDGMATDVYCLEGGLRVKIEQENRRRRWTRLGSVAPWMARQPTSIEGTHEGAEYGFNLKMHEEIASLRSQ